MRRLIFCALSLIFMASNIKADDNVTGSFVGPSTDNMWTLDVNLTNENSYSAFQMDIKLPKGLTVKSVTPVAARLVKGENVTINSTSVETPFIVTYNVLKESTNTIRITGYNLGNNAIAGQKGYPVVRLLLQADGEKQYSDMTANFFNVDFVKTDGIEDSELEAADANADHMDEYFKITVLENGYAIINSKGTVTADLQYGTAFEGWQDCFYNTSINLAKGNSVWFRVRDSDLKNSQLFVNDNNYIRFSSSVDIVASQNIMSLLDASCEQTTLPDYAFCGLFKDCTHLTSIPDLSHVTTGVTAHACDDMFSGCTSLKVNTIGPGTEWKAPTTDIPSEFMASMFTGTSGNFTGTPESGVTYYVNDKPYTRTMTNKWGTIVMPFDIDVADDKPYDIYELTDVSDATLVLSKREETLPAGTPAIIRMSESSKNAESGEYELSLTTDMPYSTTIKELDNVKDLRLTGSYTSKDITDEDGYIIANNAFWNIADIKGENKVYCSPYRAYLAGSLSNGAKQLTIGFDDDIPTAVDTLNAITSGSVEYYDINGLRLNELQKGVNIVKYGNGKTKKVILK